MTSAAPLSNVVVVEIGHSVAAPFGGFILAQMGATVIKVENPGTGDHARKWGPPFRDDMSVLFETLNRDKKSIVLNLRSAEERAELVQFIQDKADVVLQNLRPHSIDELGLGAEVLLAAKPSLIYCNVSSYGHVGPMRLQPGYDPLMQAYGGIMSVTGEEGRPPIRVGVSLIDKGAGMWAAMAILAALYERDRTGKGGVLDTSLYETALSWMDAQITSYLASGEVPRRYGSGAAQIAPYKVFETADHYLMVAAGNDGLFRKLCTVIARPQWADDPRFISNAARVKNRDILCDMLQEIFHAAPRSEWIAKLEKAKIPNAALQTINDVVDNVQTQSLGIIQPCPDNEHMLVGLPISFDGVRPQFRSAPPHLGEHNDDVLGRK
ncbi:MAG: CoA transferase [Sphingomonadales bacterium]|nr:CoA transferase [Sphingomonadales bacterium]